MLQMRLCGDLILREKAAPVKSITPDILSALEEMAAMMEKQKGVGMAAPQVGILQRFLVMMDVVGRDETGKLLKMVNPKIVSRSEKTCVIEEGCLSVVNKDGRPIYADVVRPESVVVEWTDETGAALRAGFNGYAARIIQHECDHLDGILFIDYLDGAKREMVMRKVKK